MGIWSGCRSFGDSAGLLIGDLIILRSHFEWFSALIIFGIITLIAAYIIFEGVNDSPVETGLTTIIEVEGEESSVLNPSLVKKRNSNNRISDARKSFQNQSTNMNNDELLMIREKLLMKYGC